MSKILELSGMIHSKYKNESRFADAIGWTKQRLNKITTGKKEPSLSEVALLSNALDESFENVAHIFLSRSHQMGNNKEINT